jgi:Ca2+-binding RTX toxin-like protein
LVVTVSASFVLVATALAASIVGTNRSETIRGTAGAEKLYGLAGNDRLIGGAGRDVLYGGRGADRLLLRDGERDVAACGPGRDVVLADGADVVYGDCETMRVSPPEPFSPPPRPVVAGVYGGRTTQGELVAFQVDSGGALTKLAFPAVHLTCPSPLTWSHDFGEKVFLVNRDGTFAAEQNGPRVVGGADSTYRIAVSGLLTVGIATGSLKIDVAIAGASCAADLGWTAAAATLTGP